MNETSVSPSTDVRRHELLEKTAEYLLANGLGGSSLRPLAKAIGTSPRMLLYYFGSKDALLRDALVEARRQQQTSLRALTALGAGEFFHRYWAWAITPAGRDYLRLLYEVCGTTLASGEGLFAFYSAETHEWLSWAVDEYRRAGFSSDEASTLATYGFATLRGLELDLLATGDTQRLGHAVELLAADIERHANSFIHSREGDPS